MAHVSRFKKRRSDRSGFDYLENQLVKDGPYRVGADELDEPPPSKRSLGGEGDIALGDARTVGNFTSSVTPSAQPASVTNPTLYITAAGGITPSFVHPFMQVAGSNANITISANPSVVRGQEGQLLTLYGVGSTITLNHGNGVNLMGSTRCVLDSGAVLTLYYSTSNTVWNETSRGRF